MKRLAFLAAACVLGTSACSTHAPTDAELVTLLHSEGAAVDANAPLDASAVQCLRTWSGDASLTRELAPAILADAAKARCRGTLDGWIADAKRNPAKFDFAQISSPEVTRRAMALLAAHAPADETAHAATTAPAAAAAARTRPEPGPAPEIEATLAHASDLCEEAKSLTATDKSDVRLNRFVEYCASAPAAATRASVDRMKAAGDCAGIDQTARRVANSNSVVEGLLRNHKR
jgi:hypothetical protein